MVKLKQVTKVKIKRNISWISQHRSLIKFGVKTISVDLHVINNDNDKR